LVAEPPALPAWKRQVRKAVKNHWDDQLNTSASSKSSLHLLDPIDTGKLHAIWSYVEPNLQSVARVKLQTRLLSGTYTLQAHRKTFYNETPVCQLCGQGNETEVHFLASCAQLRECRASLLRPIFDRLPPDVAAAIAADGYLLSKLIINPSSAELPSSQIHLPARTRRHISYLAANACFALCVARSRKLEVLTGTVPR